MQPNGTKQNKTWRQQRGFHQFRGELPGYRQNAQRLYNKSLKTFPLGSLSLPLIHTHGHAFAYIQLQFHQNVRLKAGQWWPTCEIYPFPTANLGSIHHYSHWNPVIYSHCLIISSTNTSLSLLFCHFPVLLHCHFQSWQPEGFGAAHRGRQGLWWVGGCHHTGQVPLTYDRSPTYTFS